MRRINLGILVVAVLTVMAMGRTARASSDVSDGAYTFLMIGLPVMDAAIFMGGISSAVAGNVHIADGQSSAGWRTSNYVFGALNTASTLSYGITMGVEPDLWPFLLWPFLAHAGLATANFVIGYRVNSSQAPLVNLRLEPIGGVDRARGAFGGLSLTGRF